MGSVAVRKLVVLPLAALVAACAGQPAQRVIVPNDPAEARLAERAELFDEWQIVESQNGPGEAGIPDWVLHFYARDIAQIEAMPRFAGRYVFVGVNQGANFGALRQWAENFSPRLDLPGLVVHRAERRFTAGAFLYPGDEFGEYFMGAIRAISNGEFTGAVTEEVFWVRREMAPDGTEDYAAEDAQAAARFEYLVLVSIDRGALQNQLNQILRSVVTSVPPTREQAAAIAGIQQTFFEGF
jgi:hypothetical protein